MNTATQTRPGPGRAHVVRGLLVGALLLAALLLPASATAVEAPSYVVTIRTAQGSFRAVVTDPASVERARRELAGQGEAGVPIGPLAWGNGGVNVGHRWHVTDLTFVDATIELCDGTVRMVDRDPRYWVETVGSFCPWTSDVVALRPVRSTRR